MLDRSNLIWGAMSLAIISTLVSIGAVVVAVRAGRERDEIAVRRLAIVAADGTERVILGTIGTDPTADTGAYIQVLNNQGAPVVAIVNRQRARDGVSEPTLSLCDDEGDTVVALEAGQVSDTSRTPRLWMDGGAGDYSRLAIGISTGDSMTSAMASNVWVPAAGYPFLLVVDPNGQVVLREP
jgi:hypothetical protein